MGESYNPNCLGTQSGTDRQGQSWVGFDFSALDLPEFLHNPTFRHFVEALDHMARGIALDMFVTVLANHQLEQIKAFVMHIQGYTDREISKSLNNVDHKTVKRWYEKVTATLRTVAPLGHGRDQARTQISQKICPKSLISEESDIQQEHDNEQ